MLQPRPYRTLVLTGFYALLVGGCSWIQDWTTPEKEIKQPTPQVKLVQTPDATWLAPAEGSKPVEQMLPGRDEENRDAMRRLDKLERTVADMRSDINMMMPAMNKLAGLQADLQDMLMQQNAQGAQIVQPHAGPGIAGTLPEASASLPQGDTLSPKETSAVPSPSSSRARAIPVALTSSTSSGTEQAVAGGEPQSLPPSVLPSFLRFGEHADKTRIVVETGNNVSFSYDLDNNEHILVLSLPGFTWQGAEQGAVPGSPRIASYEATPDGKGGTQLAIQLKGPGQVLWAQALPAAAGKGPRVVVDFGNI